MIHEIQETQKIYDLLTSYLTAQQTPQTEYQLPYSVEAQDTKDNFFRALSLFVGGMDYVTPQELVNAVVEVKDVGLLVLYYKESDLFDEVFKRTSYIARSRKDKDTKQHLLDLIALTQDEVSLFNPFLLDACSKVFEALASFTREVSGAYMHLEPSGIVNRQVGHTYLKGDRMLVLGKVWELTGADSEVAPETFVDTAWTLKDDCYYTDDKIEFVLLKKDWFNMNALRPADTSVFEALVNHIMAQWFVIVFPEEAAVYVSKYESNLEAITRNLNSQNRQLNRRYRAF